ncbi:MAG: hypothetical protein Q8Q09_25045 [Deltaproteobacteria bacterium]|nr:hypothetical protein [Deltaproteobacteria bacterium]
MTYLPKRNSRSLRPSLAAWGVLSLSLWSGACGSKTGLEAPEIALDAPTDTADAADTVDVADVPDAPPRVARCRSIRYFARLGAVTNVRPDLDSPVISLGFEWSFVRRPDGSVARLFSDGSDTATFTPDLVGEFVLSVRVPAQGPMGPLACEVTVVVQPPDPRCPGYTLAEPRVADLPNSQTRVALDVVFTDPVVRSTAEGGAIFSEDPLSRTSVLFVARDAGMAEEPTAWVEREAITAEDAILRALSALGGADTLLGGRVGTTRSGDRMRRTSMRLLANESLGPDQVRNVALRAILPSISDAPLAGSPGTRAHIIEVTTVLRQSERRVIFIIAVAPEGLVDDLSTTTAIRMADIANATALGSRNERLDTRCHLVQTQRTFQADLLWLVDTSGSMNVHQDRVGRTAQRFVEELSVVGADFRLGVLQAGTERFSPEREVVGSRSFAWIDGASPAAAQRLAFEVTESPFSPADSVKPYRLTSRSGQDEQPVGAGILAYEEFARRVAIGEANPEWRLRSGAVQVAFFVTDEPGTNDLSRFFFPSGSTNPRWGSRANIANVVERAADFYRSRNIVPFGLVPDSGARTSVARCPSEANFPQCVITAAGGAFIPITIGDAREADRAFSSAMTRVIDVVAGAGSEFVLPTIPVSSTLRARVGGALAPRSRLDGFDYEDRARALVFRGARFRPMVGQEVRAAYFTWTQE